MERHARQIRLHGRSFLKATLTVLIATQLAFIAEDILPHANLSLLFLIGVLLTASRLGIETALYTSALSFFSFNYFFTQPQFSLYVADDGDIATLTFFLIVAALSGKLAARMQEEVEENRFMVERLTNLNDFSRRLATAPDSTTILQSLAQHIATTCNAPTWITLSAPSKAAYGHTGQQALPPLAPHTRQRLREIDSDGPLDGGYQLRFGTPREIRGQVYLQGAEPDAAKLELVRILCDLAAVTLERTLLVADLEQARRENETEQLRSALLASISHDLRTPLSSIIGASSSLIELGDTLPRHDCKDLQQTVLSEAERLNRYIQNLLDMTRLSGGTLTPQRDWEDIGDIIATATERLHRELAPFRVELNVPAQLPLLFIQGVLIEQALVNVLDNATRFSPPGAPITITVENDGSSINIDVCDQGPGIPASERERVFDMFYTATRGDRHSQGTGLGLAICRGLLNAHGGQTTAHQGREGSGTCIRLSLPHYNTEHGE